MMKDTLRAVLATSGASGEETRISAAIQAMVGTAADEIRTDAMGNLICVKHGQPGGKRILFCAHMDQIGLIVIDADEKGFLCVHAVGGVSAQISKGRMVVFPSGVQGVVFAKPSKEALQIKDLYVDIGASSREEALAKVDIGEVCVYRFELAEMGDFV
ncbi:MAG: M42 family peptidase, partial [Clostridia bacterium]